MAGPSDTLGSPWIPHEIRACLKTLFSKWQKTGCKRYLTNTVSEILPVSIKGSTQLHKMTNLYFCSKTNRYMTQRDKMPIDTAMA
jgi:hypothetical protein